MKNKNKKPLIYLLLLIGSLCVVGATIAYYTSSDTFSNEFNTSTYEIETQENFESPDNWTPGTTTPKTVIATNKGNTPAAVRIKLTPSWVDANGDSLPLKDNDDNEAAIINFASNLNSKWIYDNGYYYYKRALNENDSTTTLIDSVTFNPDFDINNIKDCETVNGVTTCTTEFTDYSGGKYTLQVEIETAQFDQYKSIWGTDVNLKAPIPRDKVLMVNEYDYDYDNLKTFGKNIDRSSIESIITLNNVEIPNTAIDSWDCSEAQNESVMCWYTDTDSDEKYELYIGQEGGVIANPDSSWTFSHFTSVEYLDLSYLDTSITTNMQGMFDSLAYDSQDIQMIGLNNLDMSNVTNVRGMFGYLAYNVPNVELDFTWMNLSNVTEIDWLFSSIGYNSTSVSLDVSNLDLRNVISFSSAFQNFGYNASTVEIIGLNTWDTRNVTDMGQLFDGLGHRATFVDMGDISNWNTSSVENMSSLFSNAVSADVDFSIDLSNWNTSNVTNMNNMFNDFAEDSKTWSVGDISGWDTSKVTNMGSMFIDAGYKSTNFELDLSNWDVSKVEYFNYMFYSSGNSSTTWSIGDLSNWDTSSAKDMSFMFSYAGRIATTWNSIGTLKVYATKINEMFEGCFSAKTTINIYGNPTGYYKTFNYAAITAGSLITINYSSATTNIDSIIATKSNDSNVVKGSQLD